jgi:hypothetical protein
MGIELFEVNHKDPCRSDIVPYELLAEKADCSLPRVIFDKICAGEARRSCRLGDLGNLPIAIGFGDSTPSLPFASQGL